MDNIICLKDEQERREGFFYGFCAGYSLRPINIQGSESFKDGYLDGYDQGTLYRDRDDLEEDRTFLPIVQFSICHLVPVEGDMTEEQVITQIRAELSVQWELQALHGELERISDFSF